MNNKSIFKKATLTLLSVLFISSISSCSRKTPIEWYISKNDDSSQVEPHTPVDMSKIRLNNVIRPNNNDFQELESEFLTSVREFTKDIMSLRDIKNKSAIFSPVSIQTCFSMLLESAKEETREELMKVLHISNLDTFREELKKMILNTSIDKENRTKLSIDQSVWIDDEFKDQVKKSYLDRLTNDYFAEVFGGKLNSDEMHKYLADYINDKTNHFLNVNEDAFKDYGGVLWLLNTIYLKSGWAEVFSEYSQKESTFTSIDNTKKNMTFLCELRNGGIYENDDVMITTKALKDGLYATFLLPKDDSKAESVLTDKKTMDYLLNPTLLTYKRAEISLELPQFKEQQKIDLKEDFKALGANLVFDENFANLKDMADLLPNENLYVEKACHEAGIEFTRTGVEAAAYTIIEVEKATAMPDQLPHVDFHMDRPFMYAICGRQYTPLFVGTQSIMK